MGGAACMRDAEFASVQCKKMKKGLLAAAVLLAIASGSVAQSKLNVVYLEELSHCL